MVAAETGTTVAAAHEKIGALIRCNWRPVSSLMDHAVATIDTKCLSSPPPPPAASAVTTAAATASTDAMPASALPATYKTHLYVRWHIYTPPHSEDRSILYYSLCLSHSVSMSA